MKKKNRNLVEHPSRQFDIAHEKGHKLLPVLYNSEFGKKSNNFIIPNCMYCPKCNLLFKIYAKILRGFS